MNFIDKQNDFEKISNGMVEFIDSLKSMVIASDIGEHCVASYAPFVRKNDEFYVLISEVAVHFASITQNSQKIEILFLQDEKDASSIFARRRVSFGAKASLCDEKRDEILQDFQIKFANEVAFSLIKNMADFHLIKFEISTGRLVNGFGAAFDTDGFSIIGRVGGAMPHKNL